MKKIDKIPMVPQPDRRYYERIDWGPNGMEITIIKTLERRGRGKSDRRRENRRRSK